MTRRRGAPRRRAGVGRAGPVGAAALASVLSAALDAGTVAAPLPAAPAAGGTSLLAQGLKAPPEGAAEDPASAPPAALPPGANLGSAPIAVGGAALSFPGAALSFPGAGMPFLSAPAAAPGAAPAAGGAPLRTPHGDADAGPPAAPPAGATFPVVQVALPDARMTFADSHFAAAATHFAAPSAAALPGGMAFREEGRGLRVTLDADVLFDFDRVELRRDAGSRLQRLMEEVSARIPRPAFRVEGHTDWIGSDAYNLRLSARRADSVRDWLVRQGGVPRPAVSTVGYGEGRPLAPNSTPDGRDDPEGRQRNRRVELLVTPR